MMWEAPGPNGDQRYGSVDVGNPNASGPHPQFAATPTCWCCGATPDPTRNAFLPACWGVCKTATCLTCGKCATHCDCECEALALAPIAPTITSVMALVAAEPQRAARTRARVINPRPKARGKGARP